MRHMLDRPPWLTLAYRQLDLFLQLVWRKSRAAQEANLPHPRIGLCQAWRVSKLVWRWSGR
jgi:hypothetical protein